MKDYQWLLKPISNKSKQIREEGKKKDALRAGVRIKWNTAATEIVQKNLKSV